MTVDDIWSFCVRKNILKWYIQRRAVSLQLLCSSCYTHCFDWLKQPFFFYCLHRGNCFVAVRVSLCLSLSVCVCVCVCVQTFAEKTAAILDVVSCRLIYLCSLNSVFTVSFNSENNLSLRAMYMYTDSDASSV